MDDRDELLTPKEASLIARCSVKAIYRWSQAGEIGRYRLGRLVRIKRSDLEAFIASRYEPPAVR